LKFGDPSAFCGRPFAPDAATDFADVGTLVVPAGTGLGVDEDSVTFGAGFGASVLPPARPTSAGGGFGASGAFGFCTVPGTTTVFPVPA
jgi:hypothetical protein